MMGVNFRPLPALAALAMLAGCAGSSMVPPSQLSLGKDTDGDRCEAVETRKDSAATDLFDLSYAITCRKVTASRSLGFIRSTPTDSPAVATIEASLNCGGVSTINVSGIGPATARRCFDRTIGSDAVVISFNRAGRKIIGSATRSTLGPMEEGLRMFSGMPMSKDADRVMPPSIDVAALAPPPGMQTASGGGEYFDAEVALRQGIDLNLKGLHSEASRVLNDALSRVPENASPRTRAELALEAGLADSNINFSEAAADHFKRADAVIASEPGAQDTFLIRKRDIYRALDLLNRRRFRAALVALEQLVSPTAPVGQPLQDMALLRRVNQPVQGSRNVSSVLDIPDQALLRQLVLDAQANWARSVALLALGDKPASVQALAAADSAYATLSRERIDQSQIFWIGARLDRQRGRLQARDGQYDLAVASFDKALAQLRQGAIATAGTGNEPAIAETQLERASIVSQRGDPPEVVRREYDVAIDTLIASDVVGTAVPQGYERYLDLLVEAAKNGAADEVYERFFRALQAVGEPAIARQMSSLQNVVTADPKLGVMIRDRADLEREVTSLRYQISAADPSQAETVNALETRRKEAEGRLLALNDQLSSDRRFSTINDRPATIAEVRAGLRPGEMFLKISTLDRKAYGIAITAQKTFIYPLALKTPELLEIADIVRKSIDGQLDVTGELVPYNVAAAYALFGLVSGPAADEVRTASAIVVDPSGPLERLPLSVLVTSRASVDRHRPRRGDDAFDFSDVDFLGKTASISTAASPRSFLVARSLPPSRAPKAFIGFAEHKPPETGPQFASAGRIEVGNVCSAEAMALREYASRWDPISKAEVDDARSALGDPSAPVITGADFTDTAIEKRTDLDQYEVLHFATHGLQEGQWGCDKSPPALVTTFGDANSDGLLSFSEVAALRLDANLVVLSACDTGSGVKSEALARQSGQEEAGATLEGLVRAFLTANARAVLATHWRVPAADPTPELIRIFYTTGKTATIGDALQAAQRKIMVDPEYSHPFYWGAYFLVGDSSKSMLSMAQARVPSTQGGTH